MTTKRPGAAGTALRRYARILPQPHLRPRPRLYGGTTHSAGRGLQGRRTILSRGSRARRVRLYARHLTPQGLHALATPARFYLVARPYSALAVCRTALGGWVQTAVTAHTALLAFVRVAPQSSHAADAVVAQPSWWWGLHQLAPHTRLSFPAQAHPSAPVLPCARAAGSTCLLLRADLWSGWALLLLPSRAPRFFPDSALALLGGGGPVGARFRRTPRAGRHVSLGRAPTVRGTVKNANDHPNGGRTRALAWPRTPWGRTAKRSRAPRPSFKLKPLVKRRRPTPLAGAATAPLC